MDRKRLVFGIVLFVAGVFLFCVGIHILNRKIPVHYKIVSKTSENHYQGSKYSVDIEQRELFIVYNDSLGYVKKYPTLNDYYRYNVGDNITYIEPTNDYVYIGLALLVIAVFMIAAIFDV